MTYRERQELGGDIHCRIEEKADIRFHDGALRHAKGACCYQIIRAAKDKHLSPEGNGFTYNHAPMLTYYSGEFICEYLSGPNGEHEFPSAVYLCRSKDGRHWTQPREVFPPIEVKSAPYCGPKKECIHSSLVPCIVHHRMGFYTAQNGRLLVLTFYGISPDFHTAPNNGYGVGRAVREIYSDFSMSDIYFLKYNIQGGYNEKNSGNFLPFEVSEDEGFKEACRELLSNRVVREQWWEEERLDTDFFACPGGKALSYYTLPTGRIMGVFKESLTSYTDDGGKHWSPIKKSPSIETSTGKVWGQKTCDGKYVLVYNPSPDGAHRWPLALAAGDDGVEFHGLLAIVPEISPCRYEGALKNLGAQYVRGITEANLRPDDRAMWLVYSVNKEDIWICRVPAPILPEEQENVTDDMDMMNGRNLRDTWNLYIPAWNSCELVKTESSKQVLRMRDRDPFDRTRAMRLFVPAALVKISFAITVRSVGMGHGAVLLQDRKGQNVGSIVFSQDAAYLHNTGFNRLLCRYEPGNELRMEIICDCVKNEMEVKVESGTENQILKVSTAASAERIERVVFATKYELPWQGLEVSGRKGTIGNLPGADIRQKETVLDIGYLKTETFEK